MEKDAHDYLNAELDYFQKAAEIQFTHFMQVFYFWTALVTAPITAGILVNQGNLASNSIFPIFLVLIAILGLLLSAKMFDIRCSQLTYISKINYARDALYKNVKNHLPKSYKLPYPPETDLRKEALKDFGRWMALAMSFVDAVYLGIGLGFGIQFLQSQTAFNWVVFWSVFVLYLLVGFASYFAIIMWRGPKPQTKSEEN